LQLWRMLYQLNELTLSTLAKEQNWFNRTHTN